MKKRNMIGIAAALIAALAGCSAAEPDYMELRSQALETLDQEAAVHMVNDYTISMDGQSETISTELWFVNSLTWVQITSQTGGTKNWTVTKNGEQYAQTQASELDTGWTKMDTQTVMEHVGRGVYEETMTLVEGSQENGETKIICSVPEDALFEHWQSQAQQVPEDMQETLEKPVSVQYTYYLNKEDRLSRIEALSESTMKQQAGDELKEVSISTESLAEFTPVSKDEALENIQEIYDQAVSETE